MDPRERTDELEEVIRTAIERYLTRVWTSMPVRVLTDSEGHVTDLQPTIKGQKVNFEKNEVEHFDMPTLGMAPVHFSSGGGFTITHPIKEGDEGIAVFAARCIDGWWDKGGLQPALHTRRHNLSDAMYIPGVRSNPRKLGGTGPDGKSSKPPSTTSIQIRTDSGEYYIELTKDSVNIVCETCTIVAKRVIEQDAGEKIRLDTPVIELTGDIQSGAATQTLNIFANTKIHLQTPALEVTGNILARGNIWGNVDIPDVPHHPVVTDKDSST